MKTLLTALLALGLALPILADDTPKKDMEPPKKEKEVDPKKDPEATPPPVAEPDEPSPAAATRPPLELVVVPGEASATPYKQAVSYANGGVIDVAQPNPTTIVVTMTGLTATNADLVHTSVANYDFTLNQCFTVVFNSRRIKKAKLSMEGRVIGLLRTDHSHYTHKVCKKGGTAETQPAHAALTVDGQEVVALTLPARSTTCGDDLSVYNHEGPLYVPVTPGKYELHERWGFGTTHPCFFCRGASAEFAPQPSFCPENYWFQFFKPFNGTATKDFGFQVTIKVVPD